MFCSSKAQTRLHTQCGRRSPRTGPHVPLPSACPPAAAAAAAAWRQVPARVMDPRVTVGFPGTRVGLQCGRAARGSLPGDAVLLGPGMQEPVEHPLFFLLLLLLVVLLLPGVAAPPLGSRCSRGSIKLQRFWALRGDAWPWQPLTAHLTQRSCPPAFSLPAPASLPALVPRLCPGPSGLRGAAGFPLLRRRCACAARTPSPSTNCYFSACSPVPLEFPHARFFTFASILTRLEQQRVPSRGAAWAAFGSLGLLPAMPRGR